jgi:hypothetical protein
LGTAVSGPHGVGSWFSVAPAAPGRKGFSGAEPRRVGGGERHLSFRVRQGNRDLRPIAFGMGERCSELMSAEGKCCLAFTPKINEWQGWRSVELEVRDLQPGPRARLG